MRLPVQTLLGPLRTEGAPVSEVGSQASAAGSYLPPVLNCTPVLGLSPPQMTIRLPVQTELCPPRAEGATMSEVGLQLSVAGSYRAPVLEVGAPQTMNQVPVQTRAPRPAAGASPTDVGVQASATGSYFPPV